MPITSADLSTRPTDGKREFIDRLEALRGVAAMMVAVGHSVSVFHVSRVQWLITKALQTVFSGRAAVTIFFVLSGCVLGLSLRRSRDSFVSGFVPFVLRRGFRIYPALAVTSMLILAWLSWAYHPPTHPYTTSWFQAIYPIPPDWPALWRNLALLDFSINDVTWSLRVELFGSVGLPLMHALSTASRWRGKLALMAGFVALAAVTRNRGSLFFLFTFYLGYLLPELGPPVMAWLRRKNAARGVVAFGTMCWLLARWGYDRPFESSVVEAVGSAALIGGILYGPEFKPYRLLDTRPARFYGRISYSFYLIHFSVMYSTVTGLFFKLPPEVFGSRGLWWGMALAVLSVALATPLSWASYRWIERPAVALGKRVSSRLRASVPEKGAVSVTNSAS